MVEHETELASADGGPVVVTRGSGDDATRLRAEGERLRAAAHPGVTRLLSSTGSAGAWELRTAHAGCPVGLLRSVTVDRATSIVGAAAATVADLHARGIVHGRLGASTVVLAADGSVVLTGLGAGDPAATLADDVACLGRLLLTLLQRDPARRTRGARRWIPASPQAAIARRAAHRLAGAASADPPSRRPSARQLAAALAGSEPPPLPRRRRRGSTLALACAVAATALLAAQPANRPGDRGADQPSPAPAPAPAQAAPCVRIDPDAALGSGCAAGVSVAGNTVEVGSRRLAVGRRGDIVVLGDWDCDGGATAAALRPSTGEVFVFDRWATATTVVVTAVTTVADARALTTERRGASPGCDALLVERGAGPPVQVPVEALR